MLEKLKKEKTLKIIVVLIAFFLYFAWSINQPYNSTPDEAMKYDVCKYIAQNNKLPHGGEESIRNSMWGISYAFSPYLSYIISAIFMKVAMFFTQNEFTIIVVARFANVIFNTLTVCMVIKIADKLFKGAYKWLFVCVIAFLPQFAFLGSYINNDSLALLASSIIIYSWIIGIESKWDLKSCLFLGVGIAICALSYYNAYGYILLSMIIFIASIVVRKLGVKELLKKGIIISLVALLFAGWWFIRNAMIYNGDFLALKTEAEYGNQYAMEEYKPSNRKTPKNTGKSLFYMLIDMDWLKLTYGSFIGSFGCMSIPLPRMIYMGYFVFFVIALFGILGDLKKLFGKNEEKNQRVLLNYCFVGAILIPIILSIYYSYCSDFQPQGRYIMPMLIPFMYFAAYGIKHHVEKDLKKYENKIIMVLALIFIIIALYCLIGIIIPYYLK